MEIKNRYIQIKQGNKVYTKQNTILVEFTKRIIHNFMVPSFTESAKINACYLKLDTPIEDIEYWKSYTYDDFDIKLIGGYSLSIPDEKLFKQFSVRSKDSVIMNYKFTNDGNFVYHNTEYGTMNEFNQFSGRKVTTIGFGHNNKCLAIVDVSNMNIVINKDEEFVVSRSDLYQSDGIVSGFDYPLHLVNFTACYDADKVSSGYEHKVAELYSVGLGNKEGIMEDEDLWINTTHGYGNEDFMVRIQRLIKKGHYPSENLLPGFYPTMDNSKYIILKYRLVEIGLADNKNYLDEYYTISYKIDLSEYEDLTKNIELTVKLERM